MDVQRHFTLCGHGQEKKQRTAPLVYHVQIAQDSTSCAGSTGEAALGSDIHAVEFNVYQAFGERKYQQIITRQRLRGKATELLLMEVSRRSPVLISRGLQGTRIRLSLHGYTRGCPARSKYPMTTQEVLSAYNSYYAVLIRRLEKEKDKVSSND